jgi:hypothetical protein
VAEDPGRLSLFWLLRGELDDALLEAMAAYDGGMLVLLCASPDAADAQSAPAVCEALLAAEREVRGRVSSDSFQCGCSLPEPAWLFGLCDGLLDGICPGGLRRNWVSTAAQVLARLECSSFGSLHPRLLDFRRLLFESA